MSNVLIVGDIVKDVYLRLDNGQNHFERDQSGVDWLDLAFDGSSQRFFARNAVLGGAAITLEVLARFGIESRISGIKAGFLGGKLTLEDPPTIYRYVVCKDDRIAYFSPSQTRPSLWRPPTDAVDYIYIDRSAMITRELAQEILQYTQLAPKTKLVMFVGKRTNLTDEHIGRILAKCDIIFTDVEMDVNLPTVRITEDTIRMEGKQIHWTLHQKQDLMTHLTAHSIIAASMLGSIINGRTPTESLLLARANVENANLDGTLNLKNLEEMTIGEEYNVKNITKEEKQQ